MPEDGAFSCQIINRANHDTIILDGISVKKVKKFI